MSKSEDEIPAEVKEVALKAEAEAELAEMRKEGYESIFDVENDPQRENPISLKGPDEEIVAAIIRNKERNIRLASELPDEVEKIEIKLPQPILQMSLAELKAWYDQTLNFWRDRVFAKASVKKWDRNASSSPMIPIYKKINDALVAALPQEARLRQAYEGPDWPSVQSRYEREEHALAEAIHRQALESAIEQGIEIPASAFEINPYDSDNLKIYKNLETEFRHRQVAAKERVNISSQIREKVLQNFQEVCKRHFQNPSGAIAEFRQLIPEIEVSEEEGSFFFRDKKTNLVYVAVKFNILPPRNSRDYFHYSRGQINYPVVETTKAAVLVKENPADQKSPWVLIEKGEIEQ